MALATAPSDPHARLHYNMVHAHDTFKLGYDTILPRLADPPKDDIANFLGYCKAWAHSIECHHNSEEEVVFPFLQPRMDFSSEIEAHKIVHAGLDEILTFIDAANTTPASFDAAALAEIMTRVKEPLYKHLDEEVAHIVPENMQQFSDEEMRTMNDALEAYAQKHGDPFLLVPFMRSHTPPEFKDSWPEMPWVLRKVVIPYALALRYRGYWKYAPYAMS
ncbi:hypothetical protein B0H21DRAFT_139849 [Amylocystis lapponica]|nr:hypothetical protein B0H21DRAFT_139849 [Amylocystis lapponica]